MIALIDMSQRLLILEGIPLNLPLPQVTIYIHNLERCIQITCELYVNCMCIHVYAYITWRQIGTTLLDFIFVAPESQDRFINATCPPCGTLDAALRSSSPYSIPEPYIGSFEGGCRKVFGLHTNVFPFSTSNCACLIQT